MNHPPILLGTSSFTASGWDGVFYPKGMRSADYLAFYAEHFHTVEVHSTFYGCPRARTINNWGARTPERFIFSVKVPQVITHDKVLVGCDAELKEFLDTMSILGPKLGPIVFHWVDGALAGIELGESLQLRDWHRASEIVRDWEANGRRTIEQPSPMSVKEACDKFTADGEARGLRAPTLYKYRLLFRQLQDFAKSNGIRFLCECDLDFLRQFRGSWPNRNMAARKKLESLRAFCRFAHDSGWLATNPAAKLKPPRVIEHPTMPLTRKEFTSLLAACDEYPDKLNAVRLRALVLLLRYSGLRITDAVTLPRDRITDGKMFLYTAKTGTPVYCPLPPFELTALDAIPTANNYFFWTGASKPKSTVGNWQRALRRLFVLAEVPTGHAHRLRDTFAIELLLAGVPMERVSMLLGHQSIRVTERHYSPWVRARQEQLEEDVRRTWSGEEGPPQVRGETGHAN